jgi:hypothetical protein
MIARGSILIRRWARRYPLPPMSAMNHASDPAARRRHLPVWLPWLAAPAFACLPVAGCGAAAALRHGRAVAEAPPQPAPSPPLVPITAVVTATPRGR